MRADILETMPHLKDFYLRQLSSGTLLDIGSLHTLGHILDVSTPMKSLKGITLYLTLADHTAPRVQNDLWNTMDSILTNQVLYPSLQRIFIFITFLVTVIYDTDFEKARFQTSMTSYLVEQFNRCTLHPNISLEVNFHYNVDSLFPNEQSLDSYFL